MNKLKPWLVLFLVFLAGFAGGVVVTRGAVRHFVHRAIQNPDFMRTMIERRMARRLRLDFAQRAKVSDILRHTQGELKDLRQGFQPRFLNILTQAQSEVSDVLTPAQREKFERLRAENQQWWQPK